MKPETAIRDESTRPKKRNMSPGRLMEALVLLLGVLSVVMLAWTHRISVRGDQSFQLAYTLMDLQLNIAVSHIELEEGYHGDQDIRAKSASAGLMRADKLCDVAINGGESEFGRLLPRLEDPLLRTQLQGIKSKLSELRFTVLPHYPSTNEASDYWDERYDTVSAELLERAQAATDTVGSRHAADQAAAGRLFYAIFAAWFCIVSVSIAGLYHRERQRSSAQSALLASNADLEHQTEELSRHRDHLRELVEERTAGLTAANQNLQSEISERKEAEAALRESEKRYRMLVDTMNEGLAVLNLQGSFTYVNSRLCELLGYEAQSLLGRQFCDLTVSEGDRRAVSQGLCGINGSQKRFEVAFRTSDGREVFTMLSPKGIYDAQGKAVGCFAVVTDVTEKIAIQAKSMRTAHLASLGELAAGVAHEINNPTNGIINYARMLCDKSGEGSAEQDLARRIQSEGRRIAEIVRALLLFARGGRKEKTPVPVNEILTNSLGLTGSQMRKDGIEIFCKIPAGLPDLVADSQEIQQVFMNILSNARHALNQKYPQRHENKLLRVEAEPTKLDNGPALRIVFHDNGVGIPPGIIDKVREPFFSTRLKGKGTGLGLSISDGIIKEHGGQLSIESVEGEYTRVIVDLPTRGGVDGQDSRD